MFIHYNKDTKRVNGYTIDSIKTLEEFSDTIEVNIERLDYPVNEYIVDLSTNSVNHVGLSETDKIIELEEFRAKKHNEISEAFYIESIKDVTFNNFTYYGGLDSVNKLDSVRRLIEMANIDTVTFFGPNNTSVELTLAQATEVVITLGVKFQADFAKKQDLYVKLSTCKTLSEIELINW